MEKTDCFGSPAGEFAVLLDLAQRMRSELHGYHQTYDEHDAKTAKLLNEFDAFCKHRAASITSDSHDAKRRQELAETARRWEAMAAFVVSTSQAAMNLQHCLDIGKRLNWPNEAATHAEYLAGAICTEFRKQFGRELFEQSRNP